MNRLLEIDTVCPEYSDDVHWSSTTVVNNSTNAHLMSMNSVIFDVVKSSGSAFFWPVRGGQ